ncbi:MAG: ACP S-malonyltransferase [Halanaerobiaceae bacterium]
MSTDFVFLYPGQGAQQVGMGKEFYEEFSVARHLMDQADELVDFDLKQLCFEGPEEKLNTTKFTQPAVFVVSMMATGVLAEKGIKPAATAGHSLGEYAALCAAGVYDFATGLELVRRRGELMNDAFPPGMGTMVAVIGLGDEEVSSLCSRVEGICEVANYNSPGQIVVSGEKEALSSFTEFAEKEGARKVIELDVSGPFHCSLMEAAQEEFVSYLESLDFSVPDIPVVANVSADFVETAAEVRSLLAAQLTESVRWVESMELLLGAGYEIFIESGTGRVLRGLMRRIDRSAKVLSVNGMSSLNKALNKLG